MLSEGQFVNWNCGQGMSIACDMAQDICHMVRCGGKHDYKSNGLHQANHAGKGIKYKKMSNNHSHKKSNEDKSMMFQDLRKLKPFAITAGQHHGHFPDIALSPTSTINMRNFFKWLQKHKKQISMGF